MVGTAEPSCFRASDRQPCRTMQASIWKCGRVAAGSYPTRRARGRDACSSGRHRHARPDALRALALLRRADRQRQRQPPQYDEIVPAPAAGVARRHLILAHCCSFPIRRRSPDRSKRKTRDPAGYRSGDAFSGGSGDQGPNRCLAQFLLCCNQGYILETGVRMDEWAEERSTFTEHLQRRAIAAGLAAVLTAGSTQATMVEEQSWHPVAGAYLSSVTS